MPQTPIRAQKPALIERAALQDLLSALASQGYRVIGPTVHENAVVYGDLDTVDDLPIGYRDIQEGGSYRLKRTRDPQVFGYVVGPDSAKKYLTPARVRLWQAQRENDKIQMVPETTTPGSNGHGPDGAGPATSKPLALFGVRACDVAAIAVQDRVFLQGPYIDPIYKANREKLFIVAVNCTRPGGTCFCASMQTGPKATTGYDLALTEVFEAPRHYFLVEIGSKAGAALLEGIPHEAAGPDEIQAAAALMASAADQMGRSMDTEGLKDLLYDNFEHPRWDNVAARCLTCGNCTMVCPTCFCTTVEDHVDLNGGHAERWRRWDSCFTVDYSYISGGSVRPSAKSRYRQWMSHKLATWIDQFGTSGCVGCGRCITWCPVGIDITEEVRAIRSNGEIAVKAKSGRAARKQT